MHDGTVELRDASGLWGKDAAETRDLLKGELGSSANVAAIGQAGENRVPFSIVLAEGDSAAGAAVR